MPDVDQHDHEEEQHHDAAGIDEHLHRADELCALHDEEHGHAEEREQKEERRMHGIPHRDDEDRCGHGHGSDEREYEKFRTHDAPPICFASCSMTGFGSSAGSPAYSGRDSQYSSCCM